MWYTHKEQPFRFGLWTVLNGVLPIPFLVIYYGMLFSLFILNIRLRSVLKGLGHATHAPLAPGRLIFLLIGMISCLCGILLVCVPVTPKSISLNHSPVLLPA
jgi:MFS transporter, ACS family, allantoate permease